MLCLKDLLVAGVYIATQLCFASLILLNCCLIMVLEVEEEWIVQ